MQFFEIVARGEKLMVFVALQALPLSLVLRKAVGLALRDYQPGKTQPAPDWAGSPELHLLLELRILPRFRLPRQTRSCRRQRLLEAPRLDRAAELVFSSSVGGSETRSALPSLPYLRRVRQWPYAHSYRASGSC